jgi:DNA-binding NtrC family response regulator
MSQLILIVDDDPTQRRLLESQAQRFGYRTITAEGGRQALEHLCGPDANAISLVLLDLVMPDFGGIEVLEDVKPRRPSLPVIVLTAQGGIDTVVGAMRAGADDFIVKPASPERLQVSIQNALKLTALTGEITRLTRRADGQMTFDDLIAKSPAMQQVIRLGKRAAASQIPILIDGESGVGKEVIARSIQGESERQGKPFVTVNCGAIPESLVESILFGHEKGSFTGASGKHMGKFQEANGGTLFLDEIGELPLDMQVKLLRALQEGEVDPVGAKRPVKVDIRLISATNKNLLELAERGDFREDLYYRLNVFPINVPPLRDRVEDIADLISHFVTRFASEEGKKVVGVNGEALTQLLHYAWPGNVRQLENAVFRAVVLCDNNMLCNEDFPQILKAETSHFQTSMPSEVSAKINGEAPAGIDGSANGVFSAETQNTPPDLIAIPAQIEDSHPQMDGDEIAITDDSGHFRKLQEIEGEMIRLAIDRYSGHMSEVARRLGIGRSTLYRKVRELGLEVRSNAN